MACYAPDILTVLTGRTSVLSPDVLLNHATFGAKCCRRLIIGLMGGKPPTRAGRVSGTSGKFHVFHHRQNDFRT